MKKGFAVFIALVCVQLAYGQKGKVTTAISYFTQGRLDKAKETIDAAIKEESCIDWAKAHLVKGQVYQAIYESPNADYRKLSSDALDVAWEAYQEAIRLDKKGKYAKEIRTQYRNLEIDLSNRGNDFYRTNKFEQAMVDFKRILQIQESPFGNQKTDTVVIYNVAISAQQAGKTEEALRYYKKALALNYEPVRSYSMIARIQLEQARELSEAGEEELADKLEKEGLKYLMEGHEKFPEDTYMLVELTNYHLLQDQLEVALRYLDKAIDLRNDRAEYYRVKGTLFEKMNRTDDAVQMYRKALELDPGDFISQYNLSNILLAAVIKKHEELIALENIKEFNTGIGVILSQYESVVPYFEKALELKPGDRNVMQTLSQLYFRLRNRPHSDYMLKYEKMQVLLEN